MKKTLFTSAITGAVLLAPSAWSQTVPAEVPDLAGSLVEPVPASRNKLSLSYRMGLNVSASFKKLGGFPSLTDPGPATGAAYNRNYDNGYNRVDSSGNAGGLTWYWGYQNPASVQGNQLSLQSSSSPNNLETKDNDADPQHGFEISYSRELYRKEKWHFGAEAAFGYSSLSISDSRDLRGTVNRITDTFSLGDIVPPLAPYNGTFEGPGALIDSSPDRVRTILSQSASVSGQRTLDTDLFTLRVGPYFEVPLYKKLSAILSGGLLVVYADSQFSYTETVRIGDLPPLHRGMSASQGDWLVGGYVGANLSYAFTDEWSAFAGAQLQFAGDAVTDTPAILRRPMDRKEAVLNLGEAVVISIGVSYSF